VVREEAQYAACQTRQQRAGLRAVVRGAGAAMRVSLLTREAAYAGQRVWKVAVSACARVAVRGGAAGEARRRAPCYSSARCLPSRTQASAMVPPVALRTFLYAAAP